MSLDDHQNASGPTPSLTHAQESSLHVVRRLRRAFLSICRCGDVTFSPYRLTTDQYSLMRAVQRNPGIRQADLTEQIFAEPNTVTAMVTLLEKRGILRRKPSLTDGRVRLLFLTAHGQTVMQRLSADWEPMRSMLRRAFEGEAGEQALKILDRVYEEMQRAREDMIKRSNLDFQPVSNEDGAPARQPHPPSPVRPGKKGRPIKPFIGPSRKAKLRPRTKPAAGQP